jgi:hypothetical protein
MKELLPHQQRVVEEKKELDDKLFRLRLFLASEKIVSVPQVELERLHRQLDAMQEYSNILSERIDAF